MTLREYLDREGLTYTAFARLIGSQHARTVQRYSENHQVPNPTMMRRIAEATSNDVTPNDFFGIAVVEQLDHAALDSAPVLDCAPGKSGELAAAPTAASPPFADRPHGTVQTASRAITA